jgi:hypothetical protein
MSDEDVVGEVGCPVNTERPFFTPDTNSDAVLLIATILVIVGSAMNLFAFALGAAP